MPITELQRQDRRRYLGSSDVVKLFGGKAWEVWAEKTGRVADREATPAMELGNECEPVVLRLAERRLGPLLRNQFRRVEGYPLAAHVDAIVRETGEPVEAKTSGINGPVFGEWGEAGTDEVPDQHVIQCHVHMLATEQPLCHLPALLGGRGFVLFAVPFNAELGDMILERASRFWELNVLADVPPPESIPTLDILKRLRRVPKSVARGIDPQLKLDYATAAAALATAKKEKEEIESRLLAKIGDCEAGEFADGSLATFYEYQRKGYTVQPSIYRALKFPKMKGDGHE